MNQFLWPATLHHLRRDSPEPKRLARFYGELLGDPVERIGAALWQVHGPARRMVVGEGEAAAVPYFALSVADADRLARFRQELEQAGVATSAVASPLLGPGAFKVTDPDGRAVVFDSPGLKAPQQQSGPAARLQHFVCATSRLSAMLQFYRDRLGLVESDRVLDPATPGDELSAVFLRSDEEPSARRSRARTTTPMRPQGGWTSATGPIAWGACASPYGGGRGATGSATTCSS